MQTIKSKNSLYSGKNMHLNFLMKSIIEREASFQKQFRPRGQGNTEND